MTRDFFLILLSSFPWLFASINLSSLVSITWWIFYLSCSYFSSIFFYLRSSLLYISIDCCNVGISLFFSLLSSTWSWRTTGEYSSSINPNLSYPYPETSNSSSFSWLDSITSASSGYTAFDGFCYLICSLPSSFSVPFFFLLVTWPSLCLSSSSRSMWCGCCCFCCFNGVGF